MIRVDYQNCLQTHSQQKVTTVETIEQEKKIENAKQGDLPQTGGPGTIALTLGGIALIAGAAVYTVRSRKNDAK